MHDFLTYVSLCSSAFVAGVVNSLAGGGTLLTFPTLVGALAGNRAAEVIANTTSTVALVPGSIAGSWGFRRELDGNARWLWLLTPPSFFGGLAGALLLTRLPPSYFAILVPWLLLTASLLFLAQPYVTTWFHAGKEPTSPSFWLSAAVVVFQFFIAVYGGYFGAGIGILMLSSLGLMGIGDVHRLNAVKTILASVINGVSVLVFIFDSEIVWSFALPMAVTAILGGYYGANLGRRLPKVVIRWFVILVGLSLSAYYFHKHYVAS